MMVSTKKRLVWPDMCKGLAMILTIIWHMEYTIPNIKGIFAPFFMPIFFFLAGYFQKDSENCITFCKKRCKDLLIPFLILGVFICFLYCETGLGIYEDTTFFDCLKGLILQISGENDILWFIACLFVTQIIVMSVIKILVEPRFVIVCSVIMCIVGCLYNHFIPIHLPWHIEIACVVQIYVIAGWLCRKHSELFERFISRKSTFIIAAPSYVIAVVADKFLLQSSFDVHMGSFGNYFDFLVLSAWGGVMLLSFSRLIPQIRFISFIGRNTYYFYAFQYTGIYIASILVRNSGILDLCGNSSLMNSILMFPILIFVIIFCSLISVAINRFKLAIRSEKNN